jgi:hypothetical protein
VKAHLACALTFPASRCPILRNGDYPPLWALVYPGTQIPRLTVVLAVPKSTHGPHTVKRNGNGKASAAHRQRLCRVATDPRSNTMRFPLPNRPTQACKAALRRGPGVGQWLNREWGRTVQVEALCDETGEYLSQSVNQSVSQSSGRHFIVIIVTGSAERQQPCE